MTAHFLGVLTWLSLAVALVSSLPCCPENMPMVPTEDIILCENHTDLSLFDLCYTWFATDEFNEIGGESEIETLGFKTDKYCTGTLVNSSYAKIHGVEDKIGKKVAMVCFSDDSPGESNDHYTVYAVCLLVSSVFLFATLVFYLLLPELRDLQGKCVLFLVLSLLSGCVSLAIIQLPHVITDVDDYKCVLMAMITYFSLLSAFFWLNINCFNIWRSSVLAHMSMSERRLLLAYHVIGWGVPFVFLGIAFISHHIPGNHLKPNFGVTSCWFQGKLEKWVYFYGPVMVLLILNFIYFISTARMLWQEYRTPNPLPRIQVLRFKFCLYLKLFLAMGITWIFEVLSAIGDEPWYVTDIINCLQGVIIFFVMILFRKRVWHLLAAKRLCGVHRMNCWDTLVDEETLEGVMEQQTTMEEENRAYALVENGTKQNSTSTSA